MPRTKIGRKWQAPSAKEWNEWNDFHSYSKVFGSKLLPAKAADPDETPLHPKKAHFHDFRKYFSGKSLGSQTFMWVFSVCKGLLLKERDYKSQCAYIILHAELSFLARSRWFVWFFLKKR